MQLQFEDSSQPYSAVLISEESVIHSLSDGLDLLGNANYLGAEHIVTNAAHFSAAFYDLKSGLAGAILQKFSNYKMKLTIRGEWSEIPSRAFRDFIRECNRGEQIAFVSDQ